ncbi:jg13987 [Pararge aegeria aegeria]|uniref:Carboxylic ester hydrolase n=1 Tax=Pararge aegeria aegeria TaxID=348720 RepID=A0A8S4RAC5_9NEOP|nr:jg13987 [Pararge aegeria aegeria]
MCSSKNKSLVFLILCIQIIGILSSRKCNRDPIVTTKEGTIRGVVDELVDGSTYYRFRGIPYASAPVGNLRFKAPVPPQPWQGIRDASNFGNICSQFNETYQGDEDCLFLNVYTKTLSKNAKTPVMVFIHGGSFSQGSGNFFLPDFLLQHNVILVTLNYRLEMLGFLTLDTPEVPGNAAMRDQVMALKWVQNNIVQFGGDPNSVTIFGESSGAAAVVYHMFSPMSIGLFHRVIAESGSYDLARREGEKERAFRAGKVLGKETNNVQELLDFFKSLEASKLTNLTIATLTDDEKFRGLPAKFVPSIEKKYPGVQAFMDEDPTKMLLEGKINRVPLMIGYNSGEGLIMTQYHAALLDVYNKQPSFYVPKEIVDRITKDQLTDFGSRIKKFYVGDRDITKEDLGIIRDIQTDIHFSYTTHRFADLYSKVCQQTYMYRFDSVTELNVIKNSLNLPNVGGVSHADELFYLFYNYLNEKPYKGQKKLRDIVFKVTKLWADFAKTSLPTPTHLEPKWQPYTVQGKVYYIIDQQFSQGKYADKERMEFWNKLYEEAGLPHIAN